MIIYSSIPAELLQNTNLVANSQKYGGKLSISYGFKCTGAPSVVLTDDSKPNYRIDFQVRKRMIFHNRVGEKLLTTI